MSNHALPKSAQAVQDVLAAKGVELKVVVFS